MLLADNLQPIDIEKKLVPVENRFLFFEVSDRSFHQVAEILAKAKVRLTINGWFHGPINYRGPAYIELFQNPTPYINLNADTFFEWVKEKYIEPVNQSQIQETFEQNSEIKLENFFNVKINISSL